MSSYRVPIYASRDQGTPIYLDPSNPDILDTVNAASLNLNPIADLSKASIPLIRRGARDYADELAQGMIWMLENFASNIEPTKPLKGQLWYKADPAGAQLRVCNDPNGASIADRWGYVAISANPPSTTPYSISLAGDVNTDLPVTFTQDANNRIAVTINLPMVAKDNTGVETQIVTPRTYTRPEITVDGKGRILKVKNGAAPATGVPWATETPTRVDVNKDLNTVGKIMEGGNALLPRGSVIMWYGSTVPAGWYECNGQNGTPDLRAKFVIAAGGAYPVNSTGGSATFAATGTTSSGGSHSHDVAINAGGDHNHGGSTAQHALTVQQIPSHQHATNWGESSNHSYPKYGAVGGPTGPKNGIGSRDTDYDNWEYLTSNVGGNQGHDHGIANSGNHTHTGSATSAGAHTHTMSVTGGTVPPYFALRYIMKA